MPSALGRQVIAAAEYPRQPISDVMEYDFNIPLNGGMELLQHKAITGADTLGSAEYYPFVPPRRPLNVLDLTPRTPTRANHILYVEQTGFTDAAAPVAENGLKPEGGVTYVQHSTNVTTIATWIPVTNRMLADPSVLEAIIDTSLVESLNMTLQAQIINGNGTDPNLRGILNTPGISTYTRASGDSIAAAVRKAMTMTILTGELVPTGLVLHPTDYEGFELSVGLPGDRSTFGGGSFGGTTFTSTASLNALTIIQTPAIPQGTGLIGAFNVGCMLFDRQRGRAMHGTINDHFVRNIQVLRAELEAAFAVLRPPVFTKILL